MGLWDKLFGGRGRNETAETEVHNYFKALTAYTPVFTTWEGGLYEAELTRAAIHSFANSASKLKPEIQGSAYKSLANTLQFKPNPFMNTSQFLYRIATILSVNNNAFIVPLEDEYSNITGYYPILPSNVEVIDIGGVAYLRYTFESGERAVIEYSRVGVITSHQFKDDFFGSDNSAVKPTLQLINIQNQGIINAVKNSANIRFLARIANKIKPEAIKEERERFAAENFSEDNTSGLIISDATFADLKQVESKPYTVNAAQMKLINENVYNYFGINENILQNKFTEEEWNAFYQGKIEPFAIQLSLALSNMTYTERELAHGNKIVLTTNRLQYVSNNTKMQISTQLFDRAIVSLNDARDLWGLAAVNNGDKRYIRREYTEIDFLNSNDDIEEMPTMVNMEDEPQQVGGGESDDN
ncbi:MAG: phage portal protein, partial [Defluviitaleaceae bacterium]|nr:phage portal protein [Defluviitaleaceae bacterium]